VSFVTQQFNTITSMGRLILNVLLSFAQFEREVTGERLRDKIAASKAKGRERRRIRNPMRNRGIRRDERWWSRAWSQFPSRFCPSPNRRA